MNQLAEGAKTRHLIPVRLYQLLIVISLDSIVSACQKMILVVGLYDEFGYLGADLIILGGFGQDLACIWGSDRIGVVRAGG